KSTVEGGAKDFWYFFAWDGFRPRAQGLDQPVTFPGEATGDSLSASSTPSSTSSTPATIDTTRSPLPSAQPATSGFTVSFAALLSEDKAQQLANTIKVGGTTAHVVTTTTAGSPIYRV